jgi:hypothetical protein
MKLINLITRKHGTAGAQEGFLVVHPLDDVQQQKFDASNLGPIAMTASVRLCLLALRTYLVAMMLLVLYHVLDLAGAFASHAR